MPWAVSAVSISNLISIRSYGFVPITKFTSFQSDRSSFFKLSTISFILLLEMTAMGLCGPVCTKLPKRCLDSSSHLALIFSSADKAYGSSAIRKLRVTTSLRPKKENSYLIVFLIWAGLKGAEPWTLVYISTRVFRIWDSFSLKLSYRSGYHWNDEKTPPSPLSSSWKTWLFCETTLEVRAAP